MNRLDVSSFTLVQKFAHHDWNIMYHHGWDMHLWNCSNRFCRWSDEPLEYEAVERASRDARGRFKTCPEPKQQSEVGEWY